MSKRGTKIASFSISRPVTVGVLFAALLVLGSIAYSKIPVQLVPSGYDLPFLYVVVPTLPSNPEDIEESVALPVEEMLSTANNIQRLRTRVRSDQVNFLLNFEDGTNMAEAYNQIRDRLERVSPDLPADTLRYFIWKYNPNDQPVYWFGVSLEEGAPGAIRDHYEALEEHLVHPLERLDGVSRVEVWGASSRMVEIRLDDAKVQAAGLSSYGVIEQLRGDNFTLPGGHLSTGGLRVAVRIMSRFENLEQLRATPVAPGRRLDSIAEVSVVFEDVSTINRINGRDAVVLGIFKEASANTVEICDASRALIHDHFEEHKPLQVFASHDFSSQGEMVKSAVNDLQETALYGGLFALLILIFFIRDLRMTLMITLGMPLSMLITLIVMYFIGFSLNMLTLMGLMLSVGMVVDNSIVVVENIRRLRDDGVPPRRAAIEGTAEVTLSLLVATATTVVVFLPMILMSGNQSLSFYLGKIGFPVCISLVASLFVSLIFIPLSSLLVLSQGDKDTPPKPPPKFMGVLERLYRHGLRWSLKHRFNAIILFALLAWSTAIPMDSVKRTDQLSGSSGEITVRFDLEAAMTLELRDAYFQEVEALLNAEKESLGIDSFRVRIRRSGGSRIQVFLLDRKTHPNLPKRAAVSKRIDDLLPHHPGVHPRKAGARRTSRDGGDGSITLQLRGPDSQKLAELSEEIVRRIKLLPEVTEVEAEADEDNTDELHFTLIREQAERSGLSAAIVGSAIDYALRGRRLSDFQWPEHAMTMRVTGDKQTSQSLERLQDVQVPTPNGDTLPIRLVTQNQPAKGYGSIHREDRQTVLNIKVKTNTDDLESLQKHLDQTLANIELPRGYSLDKGQRFSAIKRDADAQSFALILAILCVFLLMGILFESVIMPLAILFSIPFAILGVYWMLYLTDTSFDVMVGVGLIILVGIVVNNGIVLIDTINQHRLEGSPLFDAVLEGSTRRLRPVLMTALTTIFGLIPMATGDTGLAGIPYAPLGRAVIGGLLASTLLTLFVVPFLYFILIQAHASRRRAQHRLLLSIAKLTRLPKR